MTRSRKYLTISLIAALIASAAICIWSGPGNPPAVSVTYLETIDGHGHWALKFGITNIGGAKVFTDRGVGEIEVFGRTNLLGVAAHPKSGSKELLPGQGQIIEVIISESAMSSIDGKWRLICHYIDNGFRTKLYMWQFGPHGPGARMWWIIPKSLRGMPYKVKATSDWIPPKEGVDKDKRG